MCMCNGDKGERVSVWVTGSKSVCACVGMMVVAVRVSVR